MASGASVGSGGVFFILYGGASILAITEPRALALGREGEGMLAIDGFGPVQFYRVRRVPLSEPLDLDNDGIDDVFELRHPQALNPLDPADAEADYDGDGDSNLVEYQRGTDPLSGPGGWTVRVVDDPAPGSREEFLTLVEAVAHVNAHLPEGRTGRIVVGSGQVRFEDVAVQGILTITGGRHQASQCPWSGILTLTGDALLGFDGGALGGLMILDFTERGGLLNDPVALGANPEEVYSPIDFDNDPLHCADYPPPQTRPDTGACVRSGLPLPN